MKNPARLVLWARFATAAIGIFGLWGLSVSSLTESSPWWLLATAALALAVVFIAIFVPFSGIDVYNGKNDVNWLWDEYLRSVERSVDIVAGDLSWLRDERRLHCVLAALVSRGCTVRVICKPPMPPKLWENIAVLLARGVEVRILPSRHRPTPFSALAVADFDDRHEMVSTCRLKTASKSGALTEDADKGDTQPNRKIYSGKRALYQRDSEEVLSLLALSNAYWSCSTPVFLYKELPADAPSTKALILDALHHVPIYKDIASEDVSLEEIRVAAIKSWCIRADKLKKTESLVDKLHLYKAPMFSPCFICSNEVTSILLPPIIEMHQGEPVAFDGVHRLWHLFHRDPDARATVLMVKTAMPLPSKPTTLPSLSLFRGQLNRTADLPGYKKEYWRSFTPMENFLKSEGKRRIEEVYQAFQPPPD